MSLSILQSIHPKYCELIAAGLKPKEARKTKPRIPTPFKTYIYQSKHKWIYRILEKLGLYQGKVIGEYICDEIQEITMTDYGRYDISDDDLKQICLSHDELRKYGKGKTIYLWHISNLKIYDKPKELSEFVKSKCDYFDLSINDCTCDDECNYQYRERNPNGHIDITCADKEMCLNRITRAPQSWCYVEAI